MIWNYCLYYIYKKNVPRGFHLIVFIVSMEAYEVSERKKGFLCHGNYTAPENKAMVVGHRCSDSRHFLPRPTKAQLP